MHNAFWRMGLHGADNDCRGAEVDTCITRQPRVRPKPVVSTRRRQTSIL